ncbi:sulfotransferase 1C2-like isoform X2 [Hemicordylus capensis]|uniref:sulfotransferase 1C2-like isoform X2 n=1 Tax=Hemicordylus capensis TaxID=884348 RepID=UPI0023021285|nr:sulfotransferase 1C2-like isoform X2 [Hemicordylus capensis]XP_053118779.1 sulfotransferase 1C2-like isoform X2 [Hemicordylus capensis]XP_053118780.1 sulfotransferase 1C2-like isoform X2 [Hemicordylus capensis]
MPHPQAMMNPKSEVQGFEPKFIQRTTVEEVEGVPLLKETVENWGPIWDFQARPDDLLICTYPKAGTTWIQEIVDMVLHGGDAQKCARAPTYERMPFIELCPPKPFTFGFEEAEAMPSPRTLKSHFPVQLVPPSFWKQNCKIIYVARNIKDSAVSYFYFHLMNRGMPEVGTWDQFLKNLLSGKLAYGSWFDHVRGWWEAKDRHPILYLFYEDMKENPAREIRKVAEFLGLEFPEPVLNQIVQHTTFESMKANPMANYSTVPSIVFDNTVGSFMRKGIVGDWKEHFTVAQNEWLDDIYAREMGDSSLTFHTQL